MANGGDERDNSAIGAAIQDAHRQFDSLRAGICPDCGATLPARGAGRATVECTACGAVWSTEHHPEPPKETSDGEAADSNQAHRR